MPDQRYTPRDITEILAAEDIERRRVLENLEEESGRKLITIIQNFNIKGSMIDNMLVEPFEGLLAKLFEETEKHELDIIMSCLGGDAGVAIRLVEHSRTFADKIRCVVLDLAKSAATIFALGCDEIELCPVAELGPIDPWYIEDGRIIRTRVVVEAFEGLLKRTLDAEAEGKPLMGLLQALRDIDPRQYQHCKDIIDDTTETAAELVYKGALKDNQRKRITARSIARNLAMERKWHGKRVGKDEIMDIKSPLRHLNVHFLELNTNRCKMLRELKQIYKTGFLKDAGAGFIIETMQSYFRVTSNR